jgi:hypothetical protein
VGHGDSAVSDELFELGYGKSHNEDCNCVSPDAEVAYNAIVNNCEHVKEVVDQSHFWLNFIKCKSCGRHFASVFMELINWNDGNDSMANAWVPLEPEEAERALVEVTCEGDLRKLRLDNHRSLWLDTNQKKSWSDHFYILPHD